MTMTESTSGPPGAWAELSRATEQLRTRIDPRAVEVANDVLQRALRSSRRSLPLRAHPPYDFVRVSDQVLIASLREAADAASRTCAVGRIFLRVDPQGVLEQITIELFVQYGEVLVEAADRVRLVVADVVAEVLGEGGAGVQVVVTHVHVSDVTVGDPHLVNPSDEPQP